MNKVGDVVQCVDDTLFGTFYMYSGVPSHDESTIKYATNITWNVGDIGLVLDVQSRPTSANLIYLRILSSAGPIGWVSDKWTKKL